MLDRRTFLTAVATLPLLPHTRGVLIGFGRQYDTGKLLHEHFAVEQWDGSDWARTRERHMKYYDGHGTLIHDRRWRQSDLEVLLEQEN